MSFVCYLHTLYYVSYCRSRTQNGSRGPRIVSPHTNDSRNTGAWPIVIFCNLYIVLVLLVCFLLILVPPTWPTRRCRPSKRPSSHTRNSNKFSPNSMLALRKEHLPTNSVWAKAASDGLRPIETISSMPRTPCPPTRWKIASRSSLSYSTRSLIRLCWSSLGWLETADWW